MSTLSVPADRKNEGQTDGTSGLSPRGDVSSIRAVTGSLLVDTMEGVKLGGTSEAPSREPSPMSVDETFGSLSVTIDGAKPSELSMTSEEFAKAVHQALGGQRPSGYKPRPSPGNSSRVLAGRVGKPAGNSGGGVPGGNREAGGDIKNHRSGTARDKERAELRKQSRLDFEKARKKRSQS
ncbi:hypothetical protein QFC24_003915 [Naganishia onofrii]|uniref:Uncharacterized protein n=1 Tax=Naganishia onofrii TaxID=1851511 RepID=A0ACC2XHY4_9TREE|nr:hypothetical protein QFC24_003915 [Naganishia onofrii]